MLNWGGTAALGICAFFYMLNLFGVVVFQRSMLDWRRRYIFLWYMCILLYVKLIWSSGFPDIYAQLEERVCLPLVYVHSSICETYLV